VLLAAAVAVGGLDWDLEQDADLEICLLLLAVLGVMVAASAASIVSLWAGGELAAICSVAAAAWSGRARQFANGLVLSSAAAGALTGVGLAFLYASTGRGTLA